MLKQGDPKKRSMLEAEAEATFDANALQAVQETAYAFLLRLMAQVCDANANSEDCYIVFGTTRAKDSVSLTLNQNGQKSSVYAGTFWDLCLEAEALL